MFWKLFAFLVAAVVLLILLGLGCGYLMQRLLGDK